MPFIPHTEQETQEMLAAIGVDNINDLFDEIPEEIRIDGLQKVPAGITEFQASRILQQRALQDHVKGNYLGAGAYEHYIPAAVWEITGRGEFLTAYTPYQAEASQGTLQLLYEFQTMMANLMAMEVSNTSLYDGASAFAEAILMAVRAHKKSKAKTILVAGSLHPNYIRVAQAIVSNQNINLITLPFDQQTGIIDPNILAEYQDQDITTLVIPQPNFFGCVEEVHALTNWAQQKNSLVIAVVNPLAAAMLTPPGQWGDVEQFQGADIACGELQPFGMPLASGGPYAGFLCCKQQYVRQMPGRLIGCTEDVDGKRGFALTLQAREQHIRRGKATSNICTNQGLLVTAATIYISLMGAKGLQRIAKTCFARTQQLTKLLTALPGVTKRFATPVFHEVVLHFEQPVTEILAILSKQGYQAGYALEQDFPEDHAQLENCLLLCATETKTELDIEQFVQAVEQALIKTMEAA